MLCVAPNPAPERYPQASADDESAIDLTEPLPVEQEPAQQPRQASPVAETTRILEAARAEN